MTYSEKFLRSQLAALDDIPPLFDGDTPTPFLESLVERALLYSIAASIAAAKPEGPEPGPSPVETEKTPPPATKPLKRKRATGAQLKKLEAINSEGGYRSAMLRTLFHVEHGPDLRKTLDQATAKGLIDGHSGNCSKEEALELIRLIHNSGFDPGVGVMWLADKGIDVEEQGVKIPSRIKTELEQLYDSGEIAKLEKDGIR